MSKTEQINAILKILNDNYSNNLKATTGLLIKQARSNLPFPDLKIILEKLVKDGFATEEKSLEINVVKGFTDAKYSITFEGIELIERGGYQADLPVNNKKNGLNGTDKLFIVKLLQINNLFPQFDPKNEGSIVSINDLIAQLTGISSAKEVAKLLRKTIDHTFLIKDLTKAEIPSKLESFKKIRPIIEKLKNEALTTLLNDLEQKVKNKQSSYN